MSVPQIIHLHRGKFQSQCALGSFVIEQNNPHHEIQNKIPNLKPNLLPKSVCL